MIQLLTADIHFSDNPREGYRWGLIDWMDQQEWDELWIIGDLTDAKDKHSYRLVNNIVDAMVYLTRGGRNIHIVMGNHDCIDPKLPYFHFLDHLPNVDFFSETQLLNARAGRSTIPVAVLPFAPSQEKAWEKWPAAEVAFFHGTATGSVVENGMQLTGVPTEAFKRFGKVWAGDIHVPQKIANLEYVGAPYHVHFGDSFTPRLIRLNDFSFLDELHFPTIKKELIIISGEADLEKLDALTENDMAKVRITLPYQIGHEWKDLRAKAQKICDERKINLCGVEVHTGKSDMVIPEKAHIEEVTDMDMVRQFAEMEKLDDRKKEVGETIVNQVQAPNP